MAKQKMNFVKPLAGRAHSESAPDDRAVEAFIENGPDGRRNKPSMKGNKRAICLTVDPELLKDFDMYALSIGMKRGPLINLLMSKAVAKGLSRDEFFK